MTFDMNTIKEGLRKYWWILAIAIFIKLTQPDILSNIDLQTQSVFGGFGGLQMSFGALLIVAGILTTILSGGTLAGPGIAIFVAGWIVLGGSALESITNLISSLSTTGFIILAVILSMGFYIFKR